MDVQDQYREINTLTLMGDWYCRAGAGPVGAPIYVRHEVVHNRFVVDSANAAR